MRSRITPALVLAALLTLVTAAAALAATRDVSVVNTAFSPQNVSIARGDTVRWTNNDPFTHTTTGNAGLNLWNTTLAPGAQFSKAFTAAGSYGYHCNIHSSMTGSVKVPISLSRSGNVITVTVASTTAAAGFTRNIWRKVGGGAWAFWMNTTARSVTMTGTAGTTYSFKSRLMRTSNSTTSGFSAIRSLTL